MNDSSNNTTNKPTYPPIDSLAWTPQLFRESVIDSISEWVSEGHPLNMADIRQKLGSRYKLPRAQSQRVLRVLLHDSVIFVSKYNGHVFVNHLFSQTKRSEVST